MNLTPSITTRSLARLTFRIAWLEWFLAAALGATLSLSVTVISILAGLDLLNALVMIFVPLTALLTSAAQTLVISQVLDQPWSWFIASILGWVAGIAAAALLSLVLPHPMNTSLLFILPVVGICLGAAQWIYLDWRLVRGATPAQASRQAAVAWWAPVTLLSFALLAIVIGRVFTQLWELLLVGILPGILNGALFAWIFTPPAAVPAQTPDPAGK